MGETALFAVSDGTTYHTPFVERLRLYPRHGVSGMGLWEENLPGDRDAERAELMAEAGLRATFCFPLTPGIFTGNAHFSHPKDPQARLQILRESIRRFAVYDPVAVVILAGAPQPEGWAESRARVVHAFKELDAIAEDVSVQLAIEVISPGAAGSLCPDIPSAVDLIADVGGGNIGILLDSWHIEDEDLGHIGLYADHIVGIQVCDRKADYRGRFDRALPGTGVIDVEGQLRAAHDAGYRGFYELEIFSDDGTFGEPVADPMWQWPAERLVSEGKRAFDEVYARATTR